MRRAELIDELERLGTRPVPLPDPRRVDALEDRLYREFVVAPSPSARARAVAARRRRRQVLVAGIGLAAAASAAAVVLHDRGQAGFQLDAATGAVVLLPGGQSRVAHAGDEIPSGGLIQIGPAGSVTIDGTNIGPAQMVLLGDAGLTLLPAPAVDSPTATTVVPEPAPSATPAPVTPAPVTAAPRATAAPRPAAAPAAAVAPLPELALTVGEENGGVHLAWTATDSQTFARYVVARGPADTRQLAPIAELTDRQITSFTDPAAAHGVELLYEIVALGTDGRPVGVSDVVSVTLQDAPVSVPDEVPPTTDSSGGALGNPSTTQPDTTGPDTTAPDPSAPDTTGPDTSGPDTSGPDTSGPDTSGPDTSGPDTSGPDTSGPDTSGPPSTGAPPASDPPPSEPPTAVPPTSP